MPLCFPVADARVLIYFDLPFLQIEQGNSHNGMSMQDSGIMPPEGAPQLR